MIKGALRVNNLRASHRVLEIPSRWISVSSVALDQFKCKVLVLGCGSGGCAVAARLTSKLGKGSVIVVDPAEQHYYQPMFTMIGGGMKTLAESVRPMSEVIPKGVQHVRDQAQTVDTDRNLVRTAEGHEIEYEALVVAVGLHLNYGKIPGVLEALNTPDGNVTSIYSPKYVNRHLAAMHRFEKGNIIFTFPTPPIKCPGAPQKICYITEHFLRKHNKRQDANISYMTALPVIFAAKLYADALWKVANERSISVHLQQNLVEVLPKENVAIFEHVEDPTKRTRYHYDLLHVTPPQEPAAMLKQNAHLTNAAGYVDVDQYTLQHTRYPNVFGLGDCTSTPNPKTMAAAATQTGVVVNNLLAFMNKQPMTESYSGYTSCPLVTGYDSCILSEFDYDFQPLETFPIAQDRERYSMFLLKKHVFPLLYWHGMVPGCWTGPAYVRKLLSVFNIEKTHK